MIQNLFSAKIWKKSLQIDSDVKEDILHQIQNNYEKHSSFLHPEWKCNIHSTIAENNYINYNNILPYFTKEYEIFTKEIDLNSHRYLVQNCWYNYYIRGSNQEIHDHCGSNKNTLYSAVYFLKINENHPKLTFYNHTNLHLLHVTNEKIKQVYKQNFIDHSLSFQYFSLDAVEDDFIIFPSYVQHGVHIQTSDSPRITISLNFSIV